MAKVARFYVTYREDDTVAVDQVTEILATSPEHAQAIWEANNKDRAHLFKKAERQTPYNHAETERAILGLMADPDKVTTGELLFILWSMNRRTKDD